MSPTRLAASAIGVAIVAASGLAIAGPATAATSGITYVTAAQVNQAPTSDGLPGWVEYSGSALTSGVSGLAASGGAEFSYGITPYLDATTGTAVSDFVGNSSFTGADDSMLNAEVAFSEGDGNFAYIISTVPGGAGLENPTADWYLYSDIGALTGGGYYSLATIQTELAGNAALADWTIVSFGVAFDNPTSLYTATVNGAEFSFLPTPVSSAPTTLTQAAYTTTGITVTTSGFVPNETGIEVGIGNAGTGDLVGTVTADAQGVATYTYIGSGGFAGLGDYRLTFSSSTGDQFFDFTVAAALAATGTDSFVPLAAGGVLLLGGAALAIIAIRKRRTV